MGVEQETYTSQELLRAAVLDSMESKPDDCDLYLQLAGEVVGQTFPDPFYETATLRLLAAIHSPHCPDRTHLHERLGW